MTRLLVIGLDGGTDAIVRRRAGRLPNLEALRRDGVSCSLQSTVPPVTAAAWPSMLTGWNPGRHGMYDFRALDITRPPGIFGAGNPAGFAETPEFVTSARWRGAAVWDVAGVSCGISCVPMTHPAWPVNGQMIAGFPLPDYRRNHTAPPAAGQDRPPLLERADELESMGDAQVAAHCRQLIERQAMVLRRWLYETELELMVGVFQAIDFAQHRLWRYLDLPDHPLYEALDEMYGAVDDLIGEARGLLRSRDAVVVVSDHGFGPHPRTLVRTDAALAAAGVVIPGGRPAARGLVDRLQDAPRLRLLVRSAALRLPGGAARVVARVTGDMRGIDRQASLAYRYPLYGPAEGVVVNVAGRNPGGQVSPGAEYEHVRDRIIEALVSLADQNGVRPVLWARRREEVFWGDHAAAAPDVIALFDPRYKPASGIGPVFDAVPDALLRRYSGVHTMDGIFVAAGAGLPAGLDLGARQIVDVAPTLLALLGRQAPEPCDGRAMVDPGADAVAVDAGAPAGDVDPEHLTAQEMETMARSLRGLGYIE